MLGSGGMSRVNEPLHANTMASSNQRKNGSRNILVPRSSLAPLARFVKAPPKRSIVRWKIIPRRRLLHLRPSLREQDGGCSFPRSYYVVAWS